MIRSHRMHRSLERSMYLPISSVSLTRNVEIHRMTFFRYRHIIFYASLHQSYCIRHGETIMILTRNLDVTCINPNAVDQWMCDHRIRKMRSPCQIGVKTNWMIQLRYDGHLRNENGLVDSSTSCQRKKRCSSCPRSTNGYCPTDEYHRGADGDMINVRWIDVDKELKDRLSRVRLVRWLQSQKSDSLTKVQASITALTWDLHISLTLLRSGPTFAVKGRNARKSKLTVRLQQLLKRVPRYIMSVSVLT